EMVVFTKPWQALLTAPAPIRLPADATEVHHEAELVVRVGPDRGADAVALGLDLTDRPRQSAAKKAGLPWTRAKGLRGSAPVGPVPRAARARRRRAGIAVAGLPAAASAASRSAAFARRESYTAVTVVMSGATLDSFAPRTPDSAFVTVATQPPQCSLAAKRSTVDVIGTIAAVAAPADFAAARIASDGAFPT